MIKFVVLAIVTILSSFYLFLTFFAEPAVNDPLFEYTPAFNGYDDLEFTIKSEGYTLIFDKY
jgi:hypothetical protein